MVILKSLLEKSDKRKMQEMEGGVSTNKQLKVAGTLLGRETCRMSWSYNKECLEQTDF